MLGSIDKGKSVPECLRLFWRKRLVERTRHMRVQVVHDERYSFGALVLRGNLFDKEGPVSLGSSLGDGSNTFARQRFAGKENARYPATPVFVVVAGRSPGSRPETGVLVSAINCFGVSSIQTTGKRAS